MATVSANKVIMDNGDIVKLIDDEAIVNISRSGLTFTATRQDGTTFTFTQKDNNTTTGTTYTAGNVPDNTTFGTNGSIKNSYDNLKGRLDGIGQVYSNVAYSGSIGANTYCPNKMTLPAGKWLITTNGYAGYSGGYAPFGLGLNTGVAVKGWQPSWFLDLSATTDVYIWNILGEAITTVNLTMTANRIGV